MVTVIRTLPALALLLAVTACGGGSGGGGEDDNAARPVARASADITEVNAGEDTVRLDGRESSSPNGDITTWEWRFLGQPEDSEADIDNADSDQASFEPDVPGEYVVRLIVGDGRAESADTQDSRVTVTAVNPDPVAVLDEEMEWIIGTVQLDGSRSRPPAGGDESQLVYHWTLTQTPEDSSAILDNGNLVYPRFNADKTGQYKARLVVEYNGRESEPAIQTIDIREANAAPIARIAELAAPVLLGDTVNLDGSVSEDADGDPLQYRWRLLSAPDGSDTELSDPTTAQSSFVADSRAGSGRFRVQLCVFDGTTRDCTEEYIESELPDGAANTPPVAGLQPSNKRTYEMERGAEATILADAYDIDGDALSFEWELVDAPDGFDIGANGLEVGSYCTSTYCPASFTPTRDGDYVIRLTASDGQAEDTATATFTARLGANRQPSALADTTSGNPTTLVGEQITLDGEGSTDPDDNRLSYDWALVQRPDNSEAVLQDATSAHPTLTPDAPGPYIARLIVTDEHGSSSSYRPGNSLYEVTVLAKGSNNPPVTRIQRAGYGYLAAFPDRHDGHTPAFDTEQPFFIENKTVTRYGTIQRVDDFTLRGDTYDPDGDQLSHLWTLVDEPDGNQFESATPENDTAYDCDFADGEQQEPCQQVSLRPTASGTYVFRYQVYDGSDFAGPYTATVHAVAGRENYPTLLLEAFAGFSFNTIPGEGRPYQYIPTGSGRDYISQSFFPHVETLSGRTGSPHSEVAGDLENPVTMSQVIYLTAAGGDYTFDVDTRSDDARFIPKLTDTTNDREITDGYVLAQGESIQVVAQVEFPDGELPHTTREQAETLAQDLNAANIRWTLNVRERPDWRIEYDADFEDGPVFLPSEVDFGKIWP
ncbi:lipoprotein [Salinisphaera sp. PC39]|uniref:PKD domain-containing protein n=1 Tax=Salinisphaera sp. PC39 TaxID=1304156 RepID=UPI00333E7206